MMKEKRMNKNTNMQDPIHIYYFLSTHVVDYMVVDIQRQLCMLALPLANFHLLHIYLHE
jgi:hypothetical protein